jgi:DNA-binding GntR family transcriptional regulator
LIESDLQRRYGVSRPTIREAVRRLAAEGLVELKHNSGATVRSLSRADVSSLFRIREVLEGLAARLAAENVGRGLAATELMRLEAEFKKSFDGSAAAYMQYNEVFHDLIVRLSGNEQLIQTARQLHTRVYRLQFEALSASSGLRETRREHQAIVRAILHAQGAKAERLMRAHVRRRLAQILADTAELFA